MFSMVFIVKEWGGNLLTQTDETVDARFFALKDLPEMPSHYHETLEDLAAYKQEGRFALK